MSESEENGDNSQEEEEEIFEIRPKSNLFPNCVVWVPIPLLTWICPVIGHIGICNSRGDIFDFSGPYSITKNDMLFGKPTKYLELKNLDRIGRGTYNESIKKANEKYSRKMHNLICQNCHHHVVDAMNRMKYDNKTHNIVSIAFDVFLKGKFVSKNACMWSLGPSVVCYALVLLVAIVAIVVIVLSSTMPFMF